MGPLSFTDKDKEKLIELLNTVAEKSTFDGLKIKDVIRIYGLLSWAQKDLLSKIDANILEVQAVKKLVEEEKPAKPKKAKVG